ncbi:MAG TPA: hypothetical protein VMW75_21555 [Thermoanaerobaculia bacterium]|nr:hypothetical protein [Thermoanaerobaculia bacterium]
MLSRSEGDLESIRNGTFKVEFPEMSFRRVRGDDSPLIRGSGYASALASGEISLQLITREKPDLFPLVTRGAAGELYQDDELFAFEATDILGERWVADRMLLDSTHGPAGTLVQASPRSLVHSAARPRSQTHALIMVFLGEVQFHGDSLLTTRTWAGERVVHESSDRVFSARKLERFEVEILRRPEFLQVSVEGISPMPPDLASRVGEVLSFLLGRTMVCSYSFNIGPGGTSETFTKVDASLRKRPAPFPPIAGDGPQEREGFWQLFERTLTYILQDAGKQPSLAAALRYLDWDPGAGFSKQALSFGVGVEALVKIVKPKGFSKINELEREKLLAAIAASGASDEYKRRADVMVKNMTNTSAKAALIEVVAENGATSKLVKAWDRVRHPASHGKSLELTQPSFDDLMATLTLGYCIAFKIVGYEGIFTDYSIRQWPLTRFPFPQRNAAGE